jgi:hypothetical protein
LRPTGQYSENEAQATKAIPSRALPPSPSQLWFPLPMPVFVLVSLPGYSSSWRQMFLGRCSSKHMAPIATHTPGNTYMQSALSYHNQMPQLPCFLQGDSSLALSGLLRVRCSQEPGGAALDGAARAISTSLGNDIWLFIPLKEAVPF